MKKDTITKDSDNETGIDKLSTNHREVHKIAVKVEKRATKNGAEWLWPQGAVEENVGPLVGVLLVNGRQAIAIV